MWRMGMCVFMGLAAAGGAFADVVNGGFETGDFTGWETFGDTAVVTAAVGSGPTEGQYQAGMITGDSLNVLDLYDFAGLNLGELFSLGNGVTLEGSAIRQTFYAEAGQTLSFDYNFLTNAPTPDGLLGTDNDFAFVVLGGLTELADAYDATNVSATMLDLETGFQTYSQLVAATGWYTLVIGVGDVFPNDFPFSDFTESGLLVDNVRLPGGGGGQSEVVPEPATMTLLGMGIAGFALKRARRRSR